MKTIEELTIENEQLKKQIEEYNAQSTLTYCVFCGAKFPMDDEVGTKVVEHVKTCEKHPLYQAQQRIKVLETALKDDATDLWKVTNAIKKEINNRDWIMDGRGSYSWDDDRYRQETKWAFEAILALIKDVQHPAQLRFHEAIK